jgi:hypothetical protein
MACSTTRSAEPMPSSSDRPLPLLARVRMGRGWQRDGGLSTPVVRERR